MNVVLSDAVVYIAAMTTEVCVCVCVAYSNM